MVDGLRWRGLMIVAVVLGVAAGAAQGEPYWFAYEGNDLPENEGWVRYATNPPAQRWLEDGSLFIDSRGSVPIVENYTVYFQGGLDPEPGEMFVMRWRLKVHEATPWEDPGVYVTSDDRYSVVFLFGGDYLLSLYEPSVYLPFKPGLFHDFELRSDDMRSYELYLDGGLALKGVFFHSSFSTCAGWGDVVSSWSVAQWDYFRFGVVPEPGTLMLMFFGAAALRGKEV